MNDHQSNLEIRIVGVQHDDSRNKHELLDRIVSPAYPIFHELPPPELRITTHFLLWIVATPPSALRTITNHLGNAQSDSECERAAKALAEREGKM